MTPFDPPRETISTLSRAISQKEVSPVEVIQSYLERIGTYDPKINAFLTVLPKQALQAARRAEKEILRGRYRGPLHGIPFAAKDLFFTRESATPAAPRSWLILFPGMMPRSSKDLPLPGPFFWAN
jgi:aspartyl-tRNA(Asn)/glutamyl-tRNA(Gln) amidotransferase subunit A